jgi:hypothetical protein
MGCCCILVISTGYLHHGLRAAVKTNTGTGLGETILATVHAHPDVGLRYFRAIEGAAASMGAIVRGWTVRLPGSQPAWQSFVLEQRALPLREVSLHVAAFTTDSLELFRLPPIAGRLFGPADYRCRAAVVNERAAAMLFAEDTVGRVLYDPAGAPAVVIGVASLRKQRSAARPTIYFESTDARAPAAGSITVARFGTAAVSKTERVELNTNVVSHEYFDAAGFALLAGRVFSDGRQGDGCRVAVVNREAAEMYFGGNATGAAVIDEVGRRTTITGVVQTGRLSALGHGAAPAIYFPMEQDYHPRMTVLLAAPTAANSMSDRIQSALEAVPGRGPIPMTVRSLEAHLTQTALAPLRIAAVILSASSATALLLSALGLYGTLSDTARRQRREIAVRIALGARWRHVSGRVLGQGARLAAAGTLFGMAGSFIMVRLLSRVVVTGEAPAAWVWMAGPGILAGMIVVASVLPARRSLMVEPLRALRED